MINKLKFFLNQYKYFDSKEYYFTYYKIGCRRNKISFWRWASNNPTGVKNKQKFLVFFRNNALGGTPVGENVLEVYLDNYPDRLWSR